ncbi:hypothetical protein [Flintibacter sp. KGMB00164]|nr:hypothetical protein [Flintibacter sp. KGMB00164]
MSTLYGHRLLWQSQGGWAVAGKPADHRRTKQVGKHQAVYSRAARL